jgi:hypothetical protein
MRARVYRILLSAAVLVTITLLLAVPAFGVSITSFTPINGAADVPNACPGGIVTISGTGFADEKVTSVSFNGVKAVEWQIGSNLTIFARVPNGATTGPISVTTAAGTTATSTATYTVFPCQNSGGGLAPTVSAAKASITSFTPAKGKAGVKVTITGARFTGAATVKIGGAPAAFKVVSDTKITATVPAKAKSGKISVTTSAGTSSSSTSFVKT